MNEKQTVNSQGYEGDFWPGFVDILSGLILIFSFLILVAGMIIAVVYQTFSTVKIPPKPYKFILTTIQKSPLTIPARYNVIEEIKKGETVQVLVRKTKQELQDIGQKTHQFLANYPTLKRKLVQEIRFLQEEIRLAKMSPAPQGETQKPRDFKGGRNNLSGADNIPPAEINWETYVDGSQIFISFNKSDSDLPQEDVLDELKNTLRNWLNSNPDMNTIQILVANAVNPYKALAQKDALKRALLLKSLLKNFNSKVNIEIISVKNEERNHIFGWLRAKQG